MIMKQHTISSLGFANTGLKEGALDWLLKADNGKSWTTFTDCGLTFGRETEKAILLYIQTGHNIGSGNPVYEEWVPKSCLRLVQTGAFFDFQIATWFLMKNDWFISKLSRAFN